MKRNLNWLIIGSMILFGSCSSSKKNPTEDLDSLENAAPTADAGTDAVPEDSPKDAPATDDTAKSDNADNKEGAQPQEEAKAEDAPASPAGSGEYDQYTVKPGDTLMKIAFEVYGDLYQWKKIYELNQGALGKASQVPVGTVLKIEKSSESVSVDRNGEKYLIKSGDTLGTISDDVYSTKRKWKRLWENNKQLIHDPNKIYAGFFLYYLFNEQDRQEKEKFDSLRSKPLAQSAITAGPAKTAKALSQPSLTPKGGAASLLNVGELKAPAVSLPDSQARSPSSTSKTAK